MGDSKDSGPIEVLPEMLDYEFVASCDSADDLRAVLNALESGALKLWTNSSCVAKSHP